MADENDVIGSASEFIKGMHARLLVTVCVLLEWCDLNTRTRTQNVVRGHSGKSDWLFSLLVFCTIVNIAAVTYVL